MYQLLMRRMAQSTPQPINAQTKAKEVESTETSVPTSTADERAWIASATETDAAGVQKLGYFIRITADMNLPPRFVVDLTAAKDGTFQPIGIGRNEALNAIVISAIFISREHAIIEQRENTLYLRDNHSSTGTFLNGRPLEAGEEAVLSHNDQVGFGPIKYEFREGGLT